MSPHELARLYVMERLSANEAEEDVRDSLSRIQSDLTDARHELALAAMAILQHGGKPRNRWQKSLSAKTWLGHGASPNQTGSGNDPTGGPNLAFLAADIRP